MTEMDRIDLVKNGDTWRVFMNDVANELLD
jgi:hypothetical protein